MSTVHQYHCAVCDTIATDCTAIEHHMFIYSLNSMRTVSDSLSPLSDLRPPKTTSNTLCGDSCIAESEWYTRLVTVSGSGS